MLIRHSALYIVAKLLPGLLGMATTAALTRLLDPLQYGRYGLALALMLFGSSTAFDWLGLAYLRVASRGRDAAVATATFVRIFAALVALTAALALLAGALGAAGRAERPMLAVGLVMAWAYAWFELVARFEVAALRPGRYLRMNLGRAAFVAIGGAGAAWLTSDPLWTALGTAAGTLAGGLLGGAGALRWGAGFDRALLRQALRFGLPLAASLALAGLVNGGTRAMVGWLGSLEALGLYTAGFVLVQNTLAVVAAGIASAGFSLAVRAVESGDAAAAQRQLRANATLLLAVLAPASLGMALTAPGIAAALVGPRYVGAVAALTPWMAAGAFFGGLRAHYLDHAFQLGGRPRRQIVVTALAAAITLGLGAALIPALGALGAAIAVAVAMAVSCGHAWLVGRSAYVLPLPWDAAWRIAASCLAMTVVVRLLPGADAIALLLQTGLGGAAYALAAIGLDLLGARTRLRRLLRGRLPAGAGAVLP